MMSVSLRRALVVLACTLAIPAWAQDGPVITVDFTSPAMTPAHWTLTLHPDGNGHFHSDAGAAQPDARQQMDVAAVDRDVHLSADYAAHVFDVAQHHHWFNEECESRMKVAFQGWKKISYAGPEGQGSCTFNYSKDKQIADLGDSLVSVSETLREGARLELLLQHDRLGLDRETEYMVDAAKDGRLKQLGAIHDILERLIDDPGVMDRVRKRARFLLQHAAS